MSTQPSSSKRFRYVVLAEKLQREIEEGIYPVGSKLPSERALASKYDVTHITIRQCFDVLEKQGLVVRSPGSGTYVNAVLEKPIIGVLFGPKLTVESAHFYRVFLTAMERQIEMLDFRCRSYDGFNTANPEIADQHAPYQTLLNDARHHPFKGYITISIDNPLWGMMQPLKDLPFSSHGLLKSEFCHDHYGFTEDCMEYAIQCGFRKIFYVRGFSTISDDLRGIKDVARKYNIAIPECLQLDGNQQFIRADAVAHMEIRRLVQQWKETGNWPDAIIVSDDIITRGVALGLLEAGPDAVRRVSVITQMNEGIEHHYGIPTIRYAFSPTASAKGLCDRLQQRLANPALPHQPTSYFRGKLLGMDNSPPVADARNFGLLTH